MFRAPDRDYYCSTYTRFSLKSQKSMNLDEKVVFKTNKPVKQIPG